MGLLEGSYYAKIALLCLVFALLLHLISFGAPYWAQTDSNLVVRHEHYGLWRRCSDPIGGSTKCNDFIDYTTSDWMKCCQAFMTLAMFTLLGGLIVTAMYAFAPNFDGEMKILVTALALCATTTIFMLISVATFGARFAEYFPNRDPAYSLSTGKLGWAFGVGTCSMCLAFAATGLLLIEMLFGEDD